jgi:hypothetical protein
LPQRKDTEITEKDRGFLREVPEATEISRRDSFRDLCSLLFKWVSSVFSVDLSVADLNFGGF